VFASGAQFFTGRSGAPNLQKHSLFYRFSLIKQNFFIFLASFSFIFSAYMPFFPLTAFVKNDKIGVC
jgi:hypothetical protein